jgi:prophage maintenance system killer protein
MILRHCLLLTTIAFAFSCKTSNSVTEVQTTQRSIADCPSYLSGYPVECGIFIKYQKARTTLRQKLDLDIEFLSKYRATRFISLYSWDKHKKKKHNNFPWMVYQPSPETWNTWERGARYLKTIEKNKKILKNHQLNKNDLIALHQAAITKDLMKWTAKYIKNAAPGKFRIIENGVNPYFTTPSFAISCNGHSPITAQINNLLLDYDLKGSDGLPLVQAKPTTCKRSLLYKNWSKKEKIKYGKNYFATVYYTKTKRVKKEFEYLLKKINTQWPKYFSDSVKPKLSPIEFAADIQRHFISIHPFGDGNGRLSRLVQDLILNSFGLPYAPAGTLKNDIFTPQKKYRADNIKAFKKQIVELEICVKKLKKASTKYIVPMDCQPIYADHKGQKERIKLYRIKAEENLNQFLNSKSL